MSGSDVEAKQTGRSAAWHKRARDFAQEFKPTKHQQMVLKRMLPYERVLHHFSTFGESTKHAGYTVVTVTVYVYRYRLWGVFPFTVTCAGAVFEFNTVYLMWRTVNPSPLTTPPQCRRPL